MCSLIKRKDVPCSDHVLTSSVRYQGTRPLPNGIYLLSRSHNTFADNGVTVYKGWGRRAIVNLEGGGGEDCSLYIQTNKFVFTSVTNERKVTVVQKKKNSLSTSLSKYCL